MPATLAHTERQHKPLMELFTCFFNLFQHVVPPVFFCFFFDFSPACPPKPRQPLIQKTSRQHLGQSNKCDGKNKLKKKNQTKKRVFTPSKPMTQCCGRTSNHQKPMAHGATEWRNPSISMFPKSTANPKLDTLRGDPC